MSRFRRVTGALMAVGLMLPTLVGSASAQDPSLCEQANAAGAGAVVAGYTVVVGTGSSGHQIVLGYGSAYLSGGSGNDVLCAWGGGNTLDGGSGNDVLIVMDGIGNTLLGDSGNDTLIGYVGDVFNGGSGKNQIVQNEAPPLLMSVVIEIGPLVDGEYCNVTWSVTNIPFDYLVKTATYTVTDWYYLNFTGPSTATDRFARGEAIESFLPVDDVTKDMIPHTLSYSQYACGDV